MRRWIGGLAIALAVGVAGGYFARGQVVHTRVSTVVEIVTTASPPPATHVLTVVVQSKDGGCLTQPLTGHTFAIRRPGNGLTEGDILALPKNALMDRSGCRYGIEFLVSPNLGFFVIEDTTGSGEWGPFDSHNLAPENWTLRLDET